MLEENKQVLKKRTLSFLWRLGGMVVVAVLSFVAKQADVLNLPDIVVVLLGLASGEISKYVNVDRKKVQEILGAKK